MTVHAQPYLTLTAFCLLAHERESKSLGRARAEGDFEAPVAVLDPDVGLRADTFSGRARFARPALVDGAAGAAWAPAGRPRVVFGFTISGGKIVEIYILADPTRLGRLDLEILDD